MVAAPQQYDGHRQALSIGTNALPGLVMLMLQRVDESEGVKPVAEAIGVIQNLRGKDEGMKGANVVLNISVGRGDSRGIEVITMPNEPVLEIEDAKETGSKETVPTELAHLMTKLMSPPEPEPEFVPTHTVDLSEFNLDDILGGPTPVVAPPAPAHPSITVTTEALPLPAMLLPRTSRSRKPRAP